MNQVAKITALVVVLIIGVVVYNAAYTVSETQQAIITQFGKPTGEPVTDAGLHFKMPFVQEVNMIEKRILDWDGRPNEMPTADKTYIVVDIFGRWKIKDPMQFFLRFRDERRAQSRLDDILGSETRNAIANHDLTEVVRSTKGRVSDTRDLMSDLPGRIGELRSIDKGRVKIEEEIFKAASDKLDDLGIELLDVRFKRINYHQSVQESIFERMISERQQIAALYRSEGAGEAAKIKGRLERDLQKIESEAYRTVLEIRGRADARATDIYAGAYNQSPEAVQFFEFIKSLDAYEEMLKGDTTLVLTTDSDLFKYLKSIDSY